MPSEYKLKSGSINVFPTTKRTFGNKSSRLLSEANLVNIVNMLLDKKSFVISNIQDDLRIAKISQGQGVSVYKLVDDNNVEKLDTGLEINIFGYYFKINKISDILNAVIDTAYTDFTNTVDIYANIRTVIVGDYIELYGTDNLESSDYLYDGLLLSRGESITDKSLKILTVYEKGGSKYCKVPKESMVKLFSRSIDNLDCGEI